VLLKFIPGKLKNLINDLRGELEKTKSENVELVASLNEERQVSEDLKAGVESLHGVNEQIAEQEQLITGKCLVQILQLITSKLITV
jgi:predicted nuclease with TOPRIM domain